MIRLREMEDQHPCREPTWDEARLLDEWNDTTLLTKLTNLLILPAKMNTRQKQLMEK
jgi:hypothetical protein